MNVRTLKKHREPIPDCPQADGREIGGFARVIERAEKDTRRLDWIERHAGMLIEHVTAFPKSGMTYQIIDFDGNEARGPTLRHALDAAMTGFPRN